MNIGSLIRGLLGDSKPGEAKSLELKEGQVVRGVVLSVSDSGKEAVVQIQGTPVRAELETPLQPGQTVNLQVAPPGEGGLPVLKPVSLGEAVLVSPQNMGEALESLGLTDSKAGREIIQAMQSNGLALTKETAAKLDAVMNAKPAGVPTSEWLEAAVISVKRGLPVTAESVKGLQQAVFGPQLHQLLSALEEQLSLWVGQEEGKGGFSGKAGENQLASSGTGAANGAKAAIISTGSPAADVVPAASKGGGQATGAGTDGNLVNREGAQPVNAGRMITTAESEQTVNLGKPESAVNRVAAEASANDERTVQAPPVLADGKGAEEANAVRNGNRTEPAASLTAGLVKENSAGTIVTNNTEDGADPGQAKLNARTLAGQEEVKTADAAAKGAVSGEAAGRNAAVPGTALLTKLQGVLAELRGALPQPVPAANTPPQAVVAPPAGAAGQVPAANTPPQAVVAPPAGAAGQVPAANTLPQAAVAPPADAAGQVPAANTPPQAVVAPPAGAAGEDPPRAASVPRGENPAAALQGQPGTASTHETESWVGRVLRLLGAEHEQQAVRGGAGVAAEARASAAAGGESRADTLKGVLLQVMSSSEVPAAVKEAAGQLVQHMTGQQLLLNTDRTAPFAQVTMFLPIHGKDGRETASVHIQSRRGRKGELDAANCRLWFDLDMKQLGQTLVDVQVVDRIVSLKLHNNDTWVLDLLEQRREDIKTAVESIGYQLSGLRTEPLPEKSLISDPDSRGTGKLVDYVPDSYKGVDYRI